MLNKVWRWIFNKKEDEEESYPYRYVKVELSQIAKAKGIIDNHNRIIKIFEGGRLKKEYPYSEQLLTALSEVDRLPIYEETFEEEKDFEFYPFEDLGSAKVKR